jgi:hypothetical protein
MFFFNVVESYRINGLMSYFLLYDQERREGRDVELEVQASTSQSSPQAQEWTILPRASTMPVLYEFI